MPSLQYSSKGLTTLNKFHRKDKVFYVEGPDDKVFWNAVLRKFKMRNFIIKDAGGKEELKKYANKIIADNSEIYVLFDCDYSDVLMTKYDHNCIIYTYGYSIENSLYNPCNISKAIAIHARLSSYQITHYKKWLHSFLNEFYDVLLLDIANEKYKKGLDILGDNCCRFLKNNNSIKADSEKIKNYYETKKRHFSADELNEIKKLIKNTRKKIEFVFRGHFMTKAIMNYIDNMVHKTSGKKFSISKEAMFSQFIAQYSTCKNNTVDLKHIKNQLQRIAI